MAYKPVFIVNDERCTNAQVFATYAEAEASAKARFMVWTMPEGWDVEETDEDVNYKWDGKDVSLAFKVAS
jgi:hypothetical protein|tara:strand:+ start:1096 stop:1305 length:210 start_codon:yes stop_codon:yes gene_type:complete